MVTTWNHNVHHTHFTEINFFSLFFLVQRSPWVYYTALFFITEHQDKISLSSLRYMAYLPVSIPQKIIYGTLKYNSRVLYVFLPCAAYRKQSHSHPSDNTVCCYPRCEFYFYILILLLSDEALISRKHFVSILFFSACYHSNSFFPSFDFQGVCMAWPRADGGDSHVAAPLPLSAG